MAHWGYCKCNGPDTWEGVAPAAKGSRQSPIDIKPAEARYDAVLAGNPLKFSYDGKKAGNLINNGHSAQINYDSEGSSLTGGPLSHKYQVAQYHLHWGKDSKSGSEHRINGQMYAAELHIVHWNTSLFKSPAEAIKEDQGLAVLGMFLKAGKEHAGLKKMTDLLSKVPYSGDTVDVAGGLDPATLLPSDTSKYFTYLGSLTTPPCFESVTWIVFNDPIEVSEEQLSAFRSMKEFAKGCEPDPQADDYKGQIVENYRPPFDQGTRTLRASWPPGTAM